MSGASLLLPVLFVPLPFMPGLIKSELTEEIIRHLFRFVDGSKKRVLTALKPELHQHQFPVGTEYQHHGLWPHRSLPGVSRSL